MPLLSVLMPVFNSEKFVKKAIESVLSQTFTGFEFLILDDGSTDNSNKIIKSFKDERIKILENKNNKGIIFSRNRLLAEAKGEFLAFLDSDDIALKKRFELQIKYFKENPNVGLLGSSAKIIDEKDKVIAKWKQKQKSENLKIRMLFHNPFVNSSVMFRKSVCENINFQENHLLSEDYLFFYKISKNCEINNLKNYLLKYRVYSSSVSRKNIEEMELFSRKVIEIELTDLFHFFNTEFSKLHRNIFLGKSINDVSELIFYADYLERLYLLNLENTIFESKLFSEILTEMFLRFFRANSKKCNSKINFYFNLRKYVFYRSNFLKYFLNALR